MVRFMMGLALVLAVPAALSAQDKPTAAAKAALSGIWKFDQSRSDTVPANPLGSLRGRAAMLGGATGGSGGGGGGGGKGGGGKGKSGGGGGGGGGATGGAGGADSGATMAPPPRAGRGGGQSPAVQYVMADMHPSETLVIAAGDTSVAITGIGGVTVTWRSDGKKHEEALMEGGLLESVAQWRDAEFSAVKSAPGMATLTRVFSVSKDGKTLQVKETLEDGPSKVEKKLVYGRDQ